MVTSSGRSMSMVRLAMAVPGKGEGAADSLPTSQLRLMYGQARLRKYPGTTDLHLTTEEPRSPDPAPATPVRSVCAASSRRAPALPGPGSDAAPANSPLGSDADPAAPSACHAPAPMPHAASPAQTPLALRWRLATDRSHR